MQLNKINHVNKQAADSCLQAVYINRDVISYVIVKYVNALFHL